MEKLITVLLVVLFCSFVQAATDKACGVDYSKASMLKKIIHVAIYELSGAAIFVCAFLL
jgi:hypothetical protein